MDTANLIKTNLYRILVNKRIRVVIIVYLLIFFATMSSQFVMSTIVNECTDPVFISEYENLTRHSENTIRSILYWTTTSDSVIMSVIFSYFWFADEDRDDGFGILCSICAHRWKVVLSNYVVLFLFTPFVILLKLAAILFLHSLSVMDVSWNVSTDLLLSLLQMVTTSFVFVSFFYFLYVFTGSFKISLVWFFAPLGIEIMKGSMSFLPFGSEIVILAALINLGPLLLNEIIDNKIISILINLAVSSLFFILSVVVVEKRDIR